MRISLLNISAAILLTIVFLGRWEVFATETKAAAATPKRPNVGLRFTQGFTKPVCMIRSDHWKLLLYDDEQGKPLDNGNRHELFHLETDPGELTNLYGKSSVKNIQQELEARLRTWIRQTGVTK